MVCYNDFSPLLLLLLAVGLDFTCSLACFFVLGFTPLPPLDAFFFSLFKVLLPPPPLPLGWFAEVVVVEVVVDVVVLELTPALESLVVLFFCDLEDFSDLSYFSIFSATFVSFVGLFDFVAVAAVVLVVTVVTVVVDEDDSV